MEKSLNDYDKNLEELERQREKLEVVMKMMGQEWSESGAGIGWLGSLDLPEIDQTTDFTSPTTVEAPSSIITSALTSPDNVIAVPEIINNTTTAMTIQPLLTNILSPNTGPSPEYLQSLLHVNEVLLAQSLANTGNNDTNDTNVCDIVDTIDDTPMLTPITDHFNSPNSPLITPEDENNTLTDANNENTQQNTSNPESEKIISPLLNTDKKLITTTEQTTTTTTQIINNFQF